jgi:hypothetical protein
MKSYRNILFFVLAVMAIYSLVSFADYQGMEAKAKGSAAVAQESHPECYTKEEINAMLGQIMNSIPDIPRRYTDEEIDNRIAEVKASIPDVSKSSSNNKIKVRDLRDAITRLETAILKIRNSIPAELKWPVKVKPILTKMRAGIPADIARTR